MRAKLLISKRRSFNHINIHKITYHKYWHIVPQRIKLLKYYSNSSENSNRSNKYWILVTNEMKWNELYKKKFRDYFLGSNCSKKKCQKSFKSSDFLQLIKNQTLVLFASNELAAHSILFSLDTSHFTPISHGSFSEAARQWLCEMMWWVLT